MEREQIVQALESKISLYKHLGLQLVNLDAEHAHFRAELSQNLNHKMTAFGGSIYAVAVMAAYSLVFSILQSSQVDTENIVIAKADIRYLKPISADFDAVCEFTSSLEREYFLTKIRAEGHARLPLRVQVKVGQELCAELNGLFVVRV